MKRTDDAPPLLTDNFLLAQWDDEFDRYDDAEDARVLNILDGWAGRDVTQTEKQLEGRFVETILGQVLRFRTTGGTEPVDPNTDGDAASASTMYTASPKFPVPDAGQNGGTGEADVALGRFGRDEDALATIAGHRWRGVPQVLGEFKDIRSGLDVPQRRKGNDRSPVRQCFDYLRHAFDHTPAAVPLKPTWGLVTDMVEFRLYHRTHGLAKYQRFVIDPTDLLDRTSWGRRRRFLFTRVFSPSQLIASRGTAPLAKLLAEQVVVERDLEKTFYLEYKAYRQRVYESIVESNPDFDGSRGELVTLTQRFLDRCLFVLFCEDMGRTIGFPPKLLQRLLEERSRDQFYSPDQTTIWPAVQELFAAMRDGGPFPPDHDIARFNGGLFATDQRLDRLVIPNRVFCARDQGTDSTAMAADRATLLYLAATYNFGQSVRSSAASATDDPDRTITLYTLGRIFEQSITELEYLHAQAERRDTPAKLAKRKREGVYYTPEWVTTYIVQEVIGARLRDEQRRIGFQFGVDLPDDQVRRYRAGGRARTNANRVDAVLDHLDRLDRYQSFVDSLTVVDPACGSGAFLITALQYLRQHYRDLADERFRVTGREQLFDQDATVRGILRRNLYGVDINPESVEITQLALWLHTAAKGEPLTTLDEHIRCGNSLVGPDFADFYHNRHQTLFGDLSPDDRERVNVFDWAAAFPDIFGPSVPEDRRGFDCVLGNPPYVKLQHMRKMKEDEVLYLMQKEVPGGGPHYRSTQTGNFDLYLPFIERGLELLNPDGRMGYIAPNVWLKNDYGKGLRRHIAATGTLDRWVDFGHYQVFDDVTVYTSLQFFRRRRGDAFAFHRIAGNELARLEWDESTPTLDLDERDVNGDHPWLLMDDVERELFDRLGRDHPRLDDERLTKAIFQGLITSADRIYHLEKQPDGRYRSAVEDSLLEMEDGLMRPLVSGVDANRYEVPATATHILFPYDLSGQRPTLFTADQMACRFPKGWAYLQRHESCLRGRERGAMNDDDWYRFGRNQNIDKQEDVKVLVPRLVERLAATADAAGNFYLDNVDVGGVIPTNPDDVYYLTAVLNSPVADFIFQRISKPFRGGYLSANKQFIAPIPVPLPDDASRSAIGDAARELQTLHTRRRDDIAAFERRVAGPQCLPDRRPTHWLWADTDAAFIKDGRTSTPVPDGLSGRSLTAWAKDQYQRRLDEHLDPIDAVLKTDMTLDVVADDGDLFLRFEGHDLITRYGVGDEAAYVAALWRHLLRTNRITPSMNAQRLVDKLLDLRTTDDAALRQNLIDRDAALTNLESELASKEAAINRRVADHYGLTDAQRRRIESDAPAPATL